MSIILCKDEGSMEQKVIDRQLSQLNSKNGTSVVTTGMSKDIRLVDSESKLQPEMVSEGVAEASSAECPTRKMRKSRIPVPIPLRTSSDQTVRQQSQPIRHKVGEAKPQQRHNHASREGGDWKARYHRLFAQMRLEKESQSRLRQKGQCCKCKNVNDNLQQELQKLKRDHEVQTLDYNKGAQDLISNLEQKQSRIDELTSLCNELFAHNSVRRTTVPLENEEMISKKFAALNAAVRSWSLTAWDLWPKGDDVRFSFFPLASDMDASSITIRDSRVFIACVWEWLLHSVFGYPPVTHDDLLNLWTDEKTARRLRVLEDRVKNLQGETE